MAIAILCIPPNLVFAANAQPNAAVAIPPLAPEGEKPAPDGPSFVATCFAGSNLKDLIARQHWVLGASVVTRSEKWGTVWRSDFKKDPDDLAPRINRILCWQTSDGHLNIEFAVGQDAPPLKAATGPSASSPPH